MCKAVLPVFVTIALFAFGQEVMNLGACKKSMNRKNRLKPIESSSIFRFSFDAVRFRFEV